MMRVLRKRGGGGSSPTNDGPNRITIVPNVKPQKTFRLFHLFVSPFIFFLACSAFSCKVLQIAGKWYNKKKNKGKKHKVCFK